MQRSRNRPLWPSESTPSSGNLDRSHSSRLGARSPRPLGGLKDHSRNSKEQQRSISHSQIRSRDGLVGCISRSRPRRRSIYMHACMHACIHVTLGDRGGRSGVRHDACSSTHAEQASKLLSVPTRRRFTGLPRNCTSDDRREIALAALMCCSCC